MAEEPDAQISHTDALEYWSNISSNVDGMLGGFAELTTRDLAGSRAYMKRLRGTSPSSQDILPRGVDCGAGIGRITKGFLSQICAVVDIVEPVEKFTEVIRQGEEWKDLREQGKIGNIYNVGLEKWSPDTKYDLIWNQWCLGHLTDTELVKYLSRCKDVLKPGGWIVIKENISSDPEKKDIFDGEDSSVTRSHEKFLKIFADSRLTITSSEVQKGFPSFLYGVRFYALQAK